MVFTDIVLLDEVGTTPSGGAYSKRKVFLRIVKVSLSVNGSVEGALMICVAPPAGQY